MRKSLPQRCHSFGTEPNVVPVPHQDLLSSLQGRSRHLEIRKSVSIARDLSDVINRMPVPVRMRCWTVVFNASSATLGGRLQRQSQCLSVGDSIVVVVINTKNVDGLHLTAGNVNVHELHGSIRQASCLECGQVSMMDEIIERVRHGENPPICKDFEGQSCNGLIKPTAVFFGEGLPTRPWTSSVDKCKETSLMIVVGSSLQVSPANSLPDVALKTGSDLAIIDLLDTPFDSRANLKIQDRAVHVAELLEAFLDL